MVNITWKQWEWLEHIARPLKPILQPRREIVGSTEREWVGIHHIEAVDRQDIDALVLEGLAERRKREENHGNVWFDEWRVAARTWLEWVSLLEELDIDEPTEKDLNKFE
jgi:hypothetical protein